MDPCRIVSFDAGTPKYVSAAAWAPYAPCPKYTVLRYFSRIWSLVYWWLILTASMASLIFLAKVRSLPVYTSFTYCWVIVEPPWTIPRLLTSCHAARTIDQGLIPPSW